MRKLFISVIAIVALTGSASAQAAPKERVVVDRFTESYESTVDCGDFGPYEFKNQFAGVQKVTVTDVFARDGELLQTVLHFNVRETQTNSVSGATLSLKGAVHEVWDYASNTRTLNGKVWLGTQPGGGTYVQDTGRITMTLDTNEPIFVAGPHEAFFGGGLDVPVCAALAEA